MRDVLEYFFQFAQNKLADYVSICLDGRPMWCFCSKMQRMEGLLLMLLGGSNSQSERHLVRIV